MMRFGKRFDGISKAITILWQSRPTCFHFNNHFNPGQDNSLLSNQGLNNLKHDHHQVLQSDLYNKDYNSDPSSLEPPEFPLVFDFKAGQLHLQQDFQCLTLHPSEVRDSKCCARNLKRIQGTLKRLFYSCYYIYALKLWMCLNENMLVLIAIILLLLSKSHQTFCRTSSSFPTFKISASNHIK
jgi:hypothetical protein